MRIFSLLARRCDTRIIRTGDTLNLGFSSGGMFGDPASDFRRRTFGQTDKSTSRMLQRDFLTVRAFPAIPHPSRRTLLSNTPGRQR